MRKIASSCIARPRSTSIRPWALKWTTLPRRATAVTAPWISPESMCRCITASISSRRSLDIPTSAGEAAGISSAASPVVTIVPIVVIVATAARRPCLIHMKTPILSSL